MKDSVTHRPRGFGFITFDSEKSVEDVLMENSFHDLYGKQVEVKRVVPKEENAAIHQQRSNLGEGTTLECFPLYRRGLLSAPPIISPVPQNLLYFHVYTWLKNKLLSLFSLSPHCTPKYPCTPHRTAPPKLLHPHPNKADSLHLHPWNL